MVTAAAAMRSGASKSSEVELLQVKTQELEARVEAEAHARALAMGEKELKKAEDLAKKLAEECGEVRRERNRRHAGYNWRPRGPL